jgi:hypothetical protein
VPIDTGARDFRPPLTLPVFRGLGPAQQESLHLIATKRAKHRQLAFGFNTLGGSGHVQAMGQAHDCLSQAARADCTVDAVNETSIDLQIVNGQTLQVTERRVTGAEIVDGDAHAQCPQFGDLPGPPERILAAENSH